MSDQTIITLFGIVIGFLTLWLKLKYTGDKADEAAKRADNAADKAGETAKKVTERSAVLENKMDHNTAITAETKDAAIKAGEHAVSCDEKWEKLDRTIQSHDARIEEHRNRIMALEMQIVTLQTSVDTIGKNVDSTRHEMRGHLQSIATKLDILGITKGGTPPLEVPATGNRTGEGK